MDGADAKGLVETLDVLGAAVPGDLYGMLVALIDDLSDWVYRDREAVSRTLHRWATDHADPQVAVLAVVDRHRASQVSDRTDAEKNTVAAEPAWALERAGVLQESRNFIRPGKTFVRRVPERKKS